MVRVKDDLANPPLIPPAYYSLFLFTALLLYSLWDHADNRQSGKDLQGRLEISVVFWVFFISCSIIEQCQCIFIKASQSLLLFLSITEDKSGLIAALYV